MLQINDLLGEVLSYDAKLLYDPLFEALNNFAEPDIFMLSVLEPPSNLGYILPSSFLLFIQHNVLLPELILLHLAILVINYDCLLHFVTSLFQSLHFRVVIHAVHIEIQLAQLVVDPHDRLCSRRFVNIQRGLLFKAGGQHFCYYFPHLALQFAEDNLRV